MKSRIISSETGRAVINPFFCEAIKSLEEDNITLSLFSSDPNKIRQSENKAMSVDFMILSQWISYEQICEALTHESKKMGKLPGVTHLDFVFPELLTKNIHNEILITADPTFLKKAHDKKLFVINIQTQVSSCPLSSLSCDFLKKEIDNLVEKSHSSFTLFLSLDIDRTILLSDETINPDLIFWLQNINYYIDDINRSRGSKNKIKLEMGMTTARISDDLEIIRREKIAPKECKHLLISNIKELFLRKLSEALPGRNLDIKNENIVALGKLNADGTRQTRGRFKADYLCEYAKTNPDCCIVHTDDSLKELTALKLKLLQDLTLRNITFIQVIPGAEISYTVPAETKHIINRWKQKLAKMKAAILSRPLTTTAKKSFFDFFRSRKAEAPAQPCSAQAVDPNQPTSRVGFG